MTRGPSSRLRHGAALGLEGVGDVGGRGLRLARLVVDDANARAVDSVAFVAADAVDAVDGTGEAVRTDVDLEPPLHGQHLGGRFRAAALLIPPRFEHGEV